MSASRGAPRPQTGVAGFDRNQWQLSLGISGKLRLESVAGFDRNQWQLSIGISGKLRLESVAGFDRNQWQVSIGICRQCDFNHKVAQTAKIKLNAVVTLPIGLQSWTHTFANEPRERPLSAIKNQE